MPLPPPPVPTPTTLSWLQTLRMYTEPASLRMLSLGFSAGLPLLLVFGTLSFWLREAGIDRTTIGFLSWVGLAYAFKWSWSPLVDRLPIPWLTARLGRRRSWLLAAQGLIMAGLVGMALTDPQVALAPVVWCAVAVAIGSATQDIALDAFRIVVGIPPMGLRPIQFLRSYTRLPSTRVVAQPSTQPSTQPHKVPG